MGTKKMFIADSAKLIAWIRRLHEDEPDPGVIVEKILAELTPHEALTVARMTLRDYVRRTIATPAPQSSPAGHHAVGTQSSHVSGGPNFKTGGAPPRMSPRIRQIRDELGPELRARLQISLPVSDDHSVPYKFLADCNAADLRYIVAKREHMAAANAAEARRYGRILEAVEQAGATTVAGLPVDTLRTVVLS
jgi:predicted component of type VI protein secretion system